VSFKPSKSELSEWLRGVRTPPGGVSVFDVRLPEVGLVMGLTLGDGNERRGHHYGQLQGARRRFYDADEGLTEEFRRAYSKLGLATYEDLWPPAVGGPCRGLEAKSVPLYLPLRRLGGFMLRAPAKVQLAFLRGLWPGDGHVSGRVKLYNTDLRIISAVSAIKGARGKAHGAILTTSSRREAIVQGLHVEAVEGEVP